MAGPTRSESDGPSNEPWNPGAGAGSSSGPEGGRGSWARANWSAPATLSTPGAITAHALRGVWLIDVHSPYADVAPELDHRIQAALAECPRGVVCALPGSLAHTPEPVLDLLASAGRHMRAWPAAPVVLSCSDPRTAGLLDGRPDGRRLQHASSLLEGWAHIMSTTPPRTAHLRFSPSALAPYGARRFLARVCLDWGMNHHLDSGALVISELVTNALIHTDSDIDVLLAGDQGRIRIGVRDKDPDPPQGLSASSNSLHGRGLLLVDALSDSSGALPTSDGGKLVWAVLGR